MIYIELRSPDGRWMEMLNGPFPITVSTLRQCRERYGREVAKKPGLLDGVGHAPQTTAREILEELAPDLDGFDRLSLGFSVVSTHCRVGEAPEGPWERIP